LFLATVRYVGNPVLLLLVVIASEHDPNRDVTGEDNIVLSPLVGSYRTNLAKLDVFDLPLYQVLLPRWKIIIEI